MRKPSTLTNPIPVKFHRATRKNIARATRRCCFPSEQETIRRATDIGLSVIMASDQAVPPKVGTSA